MRRGHGVLGAFVLATYVVLGGATAGLGFLQCVALGCWALLFVERTCSKFRYPEGDRLLVDIDLGVLLAVGLEAALLRFDGGLNGRLSPSIYVFVALVSGFARPLAGVAVVAWTLGLELALRFLTLGESEWSGFSHARGVCRRLCGPRPCPSARRDRSCSRDGAGAHGGPARAIQRGRPELSAARRWRAPRRRTRVPRPSPSCERRGDSSIRKIRAGPSPPLARSAYRGPLVAERGGNPLPHQRALDGE